MNLPAIFVPAGPMLRGNFKGQDARQRLDTWKYWDELRAGNITERDWQEIEEGIARSPGTCMTMGTASTMTSIAEALGLTLPARRDPGARRQPPRMAASAAGASSTWSGRT
jgi:dihydroxyacid dehydratase/phosphogluconate dehydratase